MGLKMNFDTMQLEFMLRLIPKVTIYRKDVEVNFYKKDDVERLFDISFTEDEHYKINGYNEFYVSTRDIFRKLISIEIDIENEKSNITIEEFKNRILEVKLKSLCKYYGI